MEHASKPPTEESLRETLRAHGVQPTAQRVAVARAVFGRQDHPTADVVLAAARAELPGVSQATVYNTLNRFVSAGLLVEVDVPGRSTRFDPRIDHHHHVYDVETGELTDLDPSHLTVNLSDETLARWDVEQVRVRIDVRRRG